MQHPRGPTFVPTTFSSRLHSDSLTHCGVTGSSMICWAVPGLRELGGGGHQVLAEVPAISSWWRAVEPHPRGQVTISSRETRAELWEDACSTSAAPRCPRIPFHPSRAEAPGPLAREGRSRPPRKLLTARGPRRGESLCSSRPVRTARPPYFVQRGVTGAGHMAGETIFAVMRERAEHR